MTALRSAVAGMKGKLEGISARVRFNGITEHVVVPEGVTFETDTVGGYPAPGPGRLRRAKEARSSTCMAAGSTGEPLRRSATSSAILRWPPERIHSSPITGSLRSTLFLRQ
jgi:hypothetical protein